MFKVAIDDSRSEVISSYVDTMKWEDLCSKVNEALSPLTIYRILGLVWTIPFLAGLTWYIVMTSTYYTSEEYQTAVSTVPYTGQPPFARYLQQTFPNTFFPIMVIGFIILGLLTAKVANKASSNIDDICDEFNTLFSSKKVTFTFEGKGDTAKQIREFNPKSWIKIEISSDSAEPDVESPVAAPEPETGGLIAEKLADLEAAKAYLTEEEYNAKRKEILG